MINRHGKNQEVGNSEAEGEEKENNLSELKREAEGVTA